MGGLSIYKHALNILLDERDLTIDELVEKCVERYGMNDEKARFYLELEAEIHDIACTEERYHKEREFVNPADIVELFEKMPDTYFDNRPGMYALYVDCRVKVGLF